MLETIKADLSKYCDDGLSVGAALGVLFESDGFVPTVVYRFGRWIDKTLTRPIQLPLKGVLLAVYSLVNGIVAKALGARIDRRASIGKGLYIAHCIGLYIGPCRLGENCTVHQHVQIGGSKAGGEKGPIWVGRNVWIGPHARVLGPVRIGDDATIGSGSVVTSDVSEGDLVAGDPARTIRRSYNNTALRPGTTDGEAARP
ncbi:MAG: DapH/DapD/GlmU-related protein [Phycisphaerae bacterium]